MTEGTPEGTPMTPEEIRQLNRDLTEKLIDKAASDPAWRQRLLDDPEAAMVEAGFPEVQQLQEIQASMLAAEETEVADQNMCHPFPLSGVPTDQTPFTPNYP